MTDLPRPPAHVAPFVDALGIDEAIRFLLHFGGSEVFLPVKSSGRTEMEREFGVEAIARLKERIDTPSDKLRIPTPRKWIARVLVAGGLPVAQTARKLHVSDTAIRNYTKDIRDARQLDLFETPPPRN